MSPANIVVENLLPCFCGPKDGGSYAMDCACPSCGSGARRMDPIHLPRSKLRNRVSMTLKDEIVIPPRLAESLRRLSAGIVREILDSTSGHPTSFYQLIPELTLPEWDPSSTGWCLSAMDPPCRQCGRDGHYNIPHVPLRIRYTKPLPSFHVAATYEWFGRSVRHSDFSRSLFASPCLIVSESVQEILRGERGVYFESVDISG